MITAADVALAAPYIAKVAVAGGQYQQNYWQDANGAPHYLVRFLVPSHAGATAGIYSQGEAADFSDALQQAAAGLP